MNNSRYADLHIHTIYSDGTYSPSKVVRKAKKKGLSIISITDHDSLEGVAEACEEGERQGIEVIPGTEITTYTDDVEVHILAYFKSVHDKRLQQWMQNMRDQRLKRAELILKKLKSFGMNIRFDEVLALAPKGNISRLHIATAMIKKKYVYSFNEAFDTYIGFGGPCYVKREKLEVEWVIKELIRLGGVPVLAHPGRLKHNDGIEKLLDFGLMGIEVYYPSHTKEQEEMFLKFAREHKLLITGGSDSHGRNKKDELIGKVKLEEKYVQALKKALIGCRL